MSNRLDDEILALRATARRLAKQAPVLRARGPAHVARVGERACALLADPKRTLGRALRIELARSTGLSEAMIAWGLDTAFAGWRVEEAVALHAEAPVAAGAPHSLAALVLAGNVFTAPLRAMLLPLVAGVPVLAKGASADDVLARYLAKALRAVDPDVGAGADVVTFAHGIEPLERTLFGHADAIAVYGDDDTVEAVRAAAGPRVEVLAHGHGLGLGYVAAAALRDEAQARTAASALARDVAAYDQRGCLSPHAIFVEAAGTADATRFAELLADALAALDAALPRGALPPDAVAAQMQWRGVAAARGLLHTRANAAVSFEGDHALRASPGYRNVGVYACRDEADLRTRAAALGHHLKALGVVGPETTRVRLDGLAPYVCDAGGMQTPPLAARLDGMHPFQGWVRRR